MMQSLDMLVLTILLYRTALKWFVYHLMLLLSEVTYGSREYCEQTLQMNLSLSLSLALSVVCHCVVSMFNVYTLVSCLSNSYPESIDLVLLSGI